MIVENLIRWVIADLKIEKQFDIEDMELMRMGFSWTEAQSLCLYRRAELLEASTIVNDWKSILERKRLVEIATLSSGFANAETQKRIQREWTQDITENLSRLKVYTLDSGVIVDPQSTGKKKFAEVLQELKNGKNRNHNAATERDAEARSEQASYRGPDAPNPVLSDTGEGGHGALAGVDPRGISDPQP